MVQMIKLPRLTILGRSLLLMICEYLRVSVLNCLMVVTESVHRLAVNATCWAVAGILFARNEDTRPTLGLALLAWVRDDQYLRLAPIENPHHHPCSIFRRWDFVMVGSTRVTTIKGIHWLSIKSIGCRSY